MIDKVDAKKDREGGEKDKKIKKNCMTKKIQAP